jgi:hypothetical protein
VQSSLCEQLLDVPIRQGKTQIPTHRQKDDFRFKLAALEQTANRRGQEKHLANLSRGDCKVATLPAKLPPLVIGNTTGVRVNRLNEVGEATSTGRVLCCSWPDVGSSDTR